MELTGETMLAAPRDAVWTALNDPAVLARCIDGVETLTAATDDSGRECFTGTMNARVGPVRARFAGTVAVTEPEAPTRYVLVGEGKGGVAGFAKGSAEVRLSDVGTADAPATRLDYTVSSTVGGKLAQLGARLIEGTAKGYAESFFAKLKAELETHGSELAAVLPDAVPAAPFPAAAVPDAVAAAAAIPAVAPATAADVADGASLHDVRPRSGLTLLLWTSLVIAAVLAVLAWQLR